MAVLKDLIVHGRSRFVNGAQFNTINAESIGATQGIFNELIATTLEAKNATIDDLTANNATVVGLLDVQGELHTNSWTNANIANIGGSFYISPTVEPTDGSTTISITRNSATSWTIQAAGTFATDFVKSDKATAGVNWPVNSLVLITGDVVVGDMVYPLGTLKGTLSATVTASAASTSKTITITGVTDAQNNSSPSVLQQLYEINNNQNINSVAFKNGKISLYKLGSYPIGILMTSMGTNSNSLIDVYGGVSANPSVRIGHLGSLKSYTDSAGNTRQPTGWGIYTDNGFFKGVIVADSGSIGKFTINSKAIYSGTHDTWNKAANGIYIGDDYISFGSGGVTYFNNTGTGKVGPWTLTANALFNAKSSFDNANAGVYIGTDYIAGGAGEKWWLKSDGSAKIGAMTLTKEGVLTVPAANVSGALTAATLSVNQLTSGTISTDILTSNNIVTDTITMGTAGSNAYIYVSKNNKSATINGENTSWRIILGNTFGVTEAGYLSASSGKIGGWTIGTNALSTGSVGAESGIKFSNSTFDASINGATRSNLMFSIGSKFGVDKDGNLYASGANITGITTDTITGGTVGSQHFVYLSTKNYGTAITVGPGTNKSDWKLIVGNRFGVDSYGNLYANKAVLTEATVSGKITATSGTIGAASATNKIQIGTDTTNASIYYGMSSLNSTSNGFYIGTDGISVGGGKFKVTEDGTITATGIEISGYAKESDIPTALSKLDNDVGFMTDGSFGNLVKTPLFTEVASTLFSALNYNSKYLKYNSAGGWAKLNSNIRATYDSDTGLCRFDGRGSLGSNSTADFRQALPLKQNTDYTVSMQVGSTFRFNFMGTTYQSKSGWSIDGDRIYRTFNTGDNTYHMFTIEASDSRPVYINRIKIEEGSTYSGWSDYDETIGKNYETQLDTSDRLTDASNTFATNKANTAEQNAKDYADSVAGGYKNYLKFDSSTGLDVGYTDYNSKVNVKGDGVRIYDGNGNIGNYISSDGMTVYKGGVNVAQFGDTAVIGKTGEDYKNLLINENGYYFREGENAFGSITADEILGMFISSYQGHLLISVKDDNHNNYEQIILDTPVGSNKMGKIELLNYGPNGFGTGNYITLEPTGRIDIEACDSDGGKRDISVNCSNLDVLGTISAAHSGVIDISSKVTSVTTGTKVSAKIVTFGKVASLHICFKNTSSIAAGSNVFEATLASAYRPALDWATGGGYYNKAALQLAIEKSTGKIYVRNASSAALTCSADTNVVATYILA